MTSIDVRIALEAEKFSGPSSKHMALGKGAAARLSAAGLAGLRPQPITSLLDVVWTGSLVGIWYFSNFHFGFGLKRMAPRFQDPQLCIFLLWTLFATGWVVAACIKVIHAHLAAGKAGGKDEEGLVKQPYEGEEPVGSDVRNMTVVAHTLGMSFTCLAFIAGSIPVVQVFKSLAPIFTTIFSMCYLNAVFPYSAVAAVTMFVGGATLSSWNTPGFSLAAVLMCMVTNLSLPLRNVLIKQRTTLRQNQLAAAGRAGPNSVRLALETAADLNLGGLVLLTPLLLVFVGGLRDPAADVAIALRLGMHRIMYEIASLMVLTRMDPVMHGSLDVLKRAVMTLVAFASFESVGLVNLVGSVLAFGTLLWYKLSVSKQALSPGTTCAFHLPERWRGTVGRGLKLALVGTTIGALRMFILPRVGQLT